eukprot:12408802-Karenia_brevis.AAC.1
MADGEGPSGTGEGGLTSRAKATAEAMLSLPNLNQRVVTFLNEEVEMEYHPESGSVLECYR